MPFANKFRAMMDFPFPGDRVGDFLVESVEVRDVPGDMGRYQYTVRMVLQGMGGQQGVRQALKEMLTTHCTTFSGYGNPYQLWFGKPEIEPLGDKRYEVRVLGAGSRIYLEEELDRFMAHLQETGRLAKGADRDEREAAIEAYLDGYRTEIKRQVDRYRGKLRRLGESETPEEKEGD